MQPKPPIWSNFFKVVVAALTSPLQLATLGFGVVLGLVFPSVSVWIIGLALVTVLARTAVLISDDAFIQSVLTSSKQAESNFILPLIHLVNQRSKNVRFSSAVEQDLQQAKASLQKLADSWQTLNPEQVVGSTGVIRDLVEKLVNQLLDLSGQEESVLKFLRQFSEPSLDEELLILQKEMDQASDSIAKEEYRKALKLKQNQKVSLQKMKNNLQRINSYNARIIAELQNTQTYLARLGVSGLSSIDYGETDYLSASLQELADDIDKFESVNLEVGQEVRKMVEKDIQSSSKNQY